MKIKRRYLFISVIALSTIGALTMFVTGIKTRTDTNKITLPSIDDVPEEHWAKLAEQKIFFGHQSVGYNIIDGVEDIIKEREHIKLNIVETCSPAEFDRPIFAHSRVGRNTDPTSKIEGFRNIMDSGVADKVDMAFFKFCYVDVMQDSNPQEILDNYSVAIEDLKARYPQTRFLHVTVPVNSTPRGAKRNLKECVKSLIGKPGILDFNKLRRRYNALLKEAWSQTDPVFDLALIESINPAGFRCYANKGAEKVYLMVPEYTQDGGHLNARGRKRVAEQLLVKLAQIANEP